MSWKDIWDYGTEAIGNAFDWLGKNEAAADFVSGAAVQMLKNQAASDQREADMKIAEMKQRREDDRTKVNYAGIENYTGNLTADGGLLTNGLLSKAN